MLAEETCFSCVTGRCLQTEVSRFDAANLVSSLAVAFYDHATAFRCAHHESKRRGGWALSRDFRSQVFGQLFDAL